MRKLFSLLLFLAFAIVCLYLTGQSCYSASVKLLDLKELVKRSNCIVVGKCVNTQCSWDDERRLIYTTVTIKVSECLKGDVPSNDSKGSSNRVAEGQTITLKIYGGTIKEEDIGMIVSGEAAFRIDEEAVVFLMPGKDVRLQSSGGSYFRTVGGAQGKYTIFTDAKSGEKFVRKMTNIQVSDTVKQASTIEPSGVMSLKEFRKRVRSYLVK